MDRGGADVSRALDDTTALHRDNCPLSRECARDCPGRQRGDAGHQPVPECAVRGSTAPTPVPTGRAGPCRPQAPTTLTRLKDARPAGRADESTGLVRNTAALRHRTPAPPAARPARKPVAPRSRVRVQLLAPRSG